MSADTDKLIAELRAGLEGVSPGKWERFPCDRIADTGGRYGIQSRNGLLVADCGEVGNAYSRGNAAHIARCSPDNIRALLDRIASLEAALAEAREERDAYAKGCDHWSSEAAEVCGEASAMMAALTDIANSDDIENALDPARNKRVAAAALSPANPGDGKP